MDSEKPRWKNKLVHCRWDWRALQSNTFRHVLPDTIWTRNRRNTARALRKLLRQYLIDPSINGENGDSVGSSARQAIKANYYDASLLVCRCCNCDEEFLEKKLRLGHIAQLQVVPPCNRTFFLFWESLALMISHQWFWCLKSEPSLAL